MNLSYLAYNLVTQFLYFSLVPPLWLHTRLSGEKAESYRQRLGMPPMVLREKKGSPRIWIHSASVGEVNAALPIIDHLLKMMPGALIILSVTTPHGYAFAQKSAGPAVVVIFVPLDFYHCIKRANSIIRPDLFACIETEIWPNLIVQAKRFGARTAILNGRISVRTIKTYEKIKSLTRATLEHIDVFSMISEKDALRIKRIGAPKTRVRVNGNAKFDLTHDHPDQGKLKKMALLLDIDKNATVFIAGSTRRDEEKNVLDAYEAALNIAPDLVLIIAPRHVERAPYVKGLVDDRGFGCRMRTDLGPGRRPRTEPVVILDTIGELQAAYGLATVVFCGGSLVPLGGQNVLEPAAWGKPVFYGPFMDDFIDASRLLENYGGGVKVADGDHLTETLVDFINNPETARRTGTAALKAANVVKGAAGRHAMVLATLYGQH